MPKIAVAGVKGSTGREFLNLLNESGIPADDVFALEAKAPLGTLVSYGEDDELDVSALDTFDFKKADIAIFATTKEQGKRFIKKATGAGCRVIDLSGATFGDSSVPLVIPELNGELLKRGNGQATDGLPQVGEFIGEETSLEWAINAEIKKVLDSDIKVHANCAFVPTFIGDAAFVNAEFDDEVDATAVREVMKAQKNVVVFDKTVDAGYVSVDDVQGEDSVYVSRVRQDVSVENGISFWTVADNLRAGGAKLAFSVMTAVLAKA